MTLLSPSRMKSLLPILFLVLGATVLAATPGTSTTVRVLTFNIKHGEGEDGKLDLGRTAATIRGAGADIVALQEVDRGVRRSGGRDEPAELAKLTGLAVQFQNNLDYQGGEYGISILSRFPVKEVHRMHYSLEGKTEPRGVIEAVLDVGGRDVAVFCTHLSVGTNETANRMRSTEQLRALVAQATAAKRPVILCGDFNATPDTSVYAAMRTFLTDTWSEVGKGDGLTIPVEHPTERIDYIWISRDAIEPRHAQVLSSEASDHLPVVAELRLK